jgi:hypothetical protein
LGSRDYLGNPKVPTVFVYLLDEKKEYQVSAFRGQDKILSRTFPELVLIAEQVFTAYKFVVSQRGHVRYPHERLQNPFAQRLEEKGERFIAHI